VIFYLNVFCISNLKKDSRIFWMLYKYSTKMFYWLWRAFFMNKFKEFNSFIKQDLGSLSVFLIFYKNNFVCLKRMIKLSKISMIYVGAFLNLCRVYLRVLTALKVTSSNLANLSCSSTDKAACKFRGYCLLIFASSTCPLRCLMVIIV